MNTKSVIEEHISQLTKEAQTLLGNLKWEINKSVYLEGENLAIMIDPSLEESREIKQLALTIFPLAGRSAALNDVAIYLQAVDQDSPICYGVLNKRGQITFHDMVIGEYRAILQNNHQEHLTDQSWFSELSAEVRNTIQTLLMAPLSSQLIRRGTSFDDQEIKFCNADKSLFIVLQKQLSGACWLKIFSSDEHYNDQLVGVNWRPEKAINGEAPETSQLLLAILAWDEESHQYEAALNLGKWPDGYELCLTNRPWPQTILQPNLAEIVQDSIASAAIPAARQAWHVVLSAPNVPQTIRELVTHLLQENELSAKQGSLWTEVKAVQQLQTQLKVIVKQAKAFFESLTQPFGSDALSLAAVRSHPTKGEAPQVGQLLSIPAKEHDLAIGLTVGPLSEQAAVLAINLTAISTGAPLPRIRVRIKDEQRKTLESALSDEEGRVTFRHILAGSYVIELKYAGETLEIPMVFDLGDMTTAAETTDS